jgi:hypothetical protein
MQIQQQIMRELADLPETKLFQVYDLIHTFKQELATKKKDSEQTFFEQLQLKQDYAGDDLITLFERDKDTGRTIQL